MSDGGALLTQFLNEIGGGPASQAQLVDFINRQSAIKANLEVPGSNSTALYAGNINGVPSYEIAQDMATRSGGKIRILDNTNIGKFMLYVFDERKGFPGLGFTPGRDFVTDQFRVPGTQY